MKDLAKRLEAETQDDMLQDLLVLVTTNVSNSRTVVSKSYPLWDCHNDIYRGRKPNDIDDDEAERRGEPKRMVIPMTFAQVNTFVAFCFLLYTQNAKFFEFVASGTEDFETINDLEEVIERDLRRQYFLQILFQSLLDTTRFGIGIIKSWFTIDKQYVTVTTEDTVEVIDGVEIPVAGNTSTEAFTKYEGNKLLSISPYNFFYDVRFPVSEWRRGSFVADETEWHINDIKTWERDGEAFGVEHIQMMNSKQYKNRGETRLKAFDQFMSSNRKSKDDQIVVITEHHSKIIPKDYGLSEETFPTSYVVTVANDTRILNVKPLGYIHDDWCYDVGLFSPDAQQSLAIGLADTIFAMQDVVSYLINSRLTSVRRSLEHNLILDPTKLDMGTIENRSPYILTKKIAHNQKIPDFVHQLQYIDTTSSHFSDADTILKLMNLVTGVNENAMGSVSSGRRSATELRAANGGAAARMKVVAKLLWITQLAPLGRKMQLNLRQGLSLESFKKILGPDVEERYAAFHPPIQDLIGCEDHFTFDSTLESEKGYTAQSLQELLSVVLSSPEVTASLTIDPSKIIEEILALRGIDNINRFKYEQQTGSNADTLQQLQQGMLGGSLPSPLPV